MALIYIDADKDIDLLQLADEIGDGVNVGTVDDRRFVSADIDKDALAEAVGAHVPDKKAIAARDKQAEQEQQRATDERRAAAASARDKLRALGLTDEEIDALKS